MVSKYYHIFFFFSSSLVDAAILHMTFLLMDLKAIKCGGCVIIRVQEFQRLYILCCQLRDLLTLHVWLVRSRRTNPYILSPLTNNFLSMQLLQKKAKQWTMSFRVGFYVSTTCARGVRVWYGMEGCEYCMFDSSSHHDFSLFSFFSCVAENLLCLFSSPFKYGSLVISIMFVRFFF